MPLHKTISFLASLSLAFTPWVKIRFQRSARLKKITMKWISNVNSKFLFYNYLSRNTRFAPCPKTYWKLKVFCGEVLQVCKHSEIQTLESILLFSTRVFVLLIKDSKITLILVKIRQLYTKFLCFIELKIITIACTSHFFCYFASIWRLFQ